MAEASDLDDIVLHYNGCYYLLEAHDWRPKPAPDPLRSRAARALESGVQVGHLTPDGASPAGHTCYLVDLPIPDAKHVHDAVGTNVVIVNRGAGTFVSFDARTGEEREIPAAVQASAQEAFATGAILGSIPARLGSSIGAICTLLNPSALSSGKR